VPFFAPLLLVVAFIALASPCLADVPLRALLDALDEGGASRASSPASRRFERLPALVRTGRARPQPWGDEVWWVAPGFAVTGGDAFEMRRLVDAHPDWAFTWAPPRRLLLDRAVPSSGAVEVRNQTGLTGRGVAVGIVDTGVDLTHRDLRNGDGSTRVAWYVDFASQPMGVHPDVEARCAAAGLSCAVLGKEEIDRGLIEGTPLPGDLLGHGTHVASLAAGNGFSLDPARFVGVAPEASLVIARATSGGLSITDADVLSGVEILFWLVDTYQTRFGAPAMPMVVNLSLGSDFGPHDGSSALGQGLAELVSDEHPGRALVVAAGNSGTLITGVGEFPEPLGIHTNVNVVGTARVPIVSPHGGSSTATLEADILVWIEMVPGDDLAVGFDRRDGPMLEPVPRGRSRGVTDGELGVTIINDVREDAPVLPAGRPGAIVLVTGRWPAGETFAVRFEGSGTTSVWLQSEGDLNPAISGLGALVPAASKEGTINIPAAHPAMIAVGATLNRLAWTDREGDEIAVSIGGAETPAVDSTVFFSSAGPNTLGHVKPDLVAPGAWLVAAMSAEADPFENPFSIFHSAGACSPAPVCGLVEDAYAVSSGSSMAAPLVAGAVALLLERDPTLTQSTIRELLLTGARPLEGSVRSEQQVGAGALDLPRTFEALDETVSASGRMPGSASRIVLAASFVEPDPLRPVHGIVQLRDDGGRIANGFDDTKLGMDASPVASPVVLEKIAPGLWDFTVTAPRGSGGAELSLALHFDERVVARKTVPIAVDASTARHGFFASGGCAVVGRSPTLASALGLIPVAVWLGRRKRRGVRAARSPDRKGTRG
jgi:subtilisin family serine protease